MTEIVGKLIDLVVTCWRALWPWVILPVEEIGFIRRLGRAQRDMNPGVNWKWPLIEKAHTVESQEGIYILDPQSLRTNDGKDLVMRVSVTFRVADARKFHLKAWGALSNLRDLVAGEVGEAVRCASAEEAFDGTAMKVALKSARLQAASWGIKIVRLRCCDLCPARSVRRWNTNTNAAGEE